MDDVAGFYFRAASRISWATTPVSPPRGSPRLAASRRAVAESRFVRAIKSYVKLMLGRTRLLTIPIIYIDMLGLQAALPVITAWPIPIGLQV